MKELKKNREAKKHRACFEQVLAMWVKESKQNGGTALEQCIKENAPESFRDEEYVRAIIHAEDISGFPGFIGRVCRDILMRKLCLDRNSGVVEEMFDLNEERLSLCRQDDPEQEYLEGIIILAESLYLTGKVRGEDALYSWEKRMLNCKNPEGIVQCIRSGFLVPERVEDYLDYIRIEGARELLPVMLNLKYQD